MPQPGSFFDVVGIPSFSLQWSNTIQEEIEAATTATIGSIDTENDFYQLTADFNKTTWSWGTSYSESDQQDNIDATRSSITKSTELKASYQFNKYLTVSPSVRLEDTDFISGDSSERDLYTLRSALRFTDTLNGQITLNQSVDTTNSSSSPQDSEVSTVSFQLNWNWIQAKNNKPGFDISLSGTYQDTQNNITPANDLDVYQVFLNLSMSLPISSVR
jgi:hypothetical protein